MKRYFKQGIMMMLSVFMLIVMTASVWAAQTQEPGQVTGLTAASGESTVSLKWKKAENAQGYQIYLVGKTTGKLIKFGKTKNTSYKAKDLINGKEYTFVVRAYNVQDGKIKEGKRSAKVKQTPHIKQCASPVITLTKIDGNKAYISWKKVSGATEYVIYKKAAGDAKYKVVGTTKKLSAAIKGIKSKSCYFAVRAKRVVGNRSRLGLVSNVEYAKSYSEIHTMYFEAMVSSDLNAPQVVKTADGNGSTSILETYSPNGGTVSIQAGTIVTIVKRTSGENIIQVPDGRLAAVSAGNLSVRSSLGTDEVYSKAVAEAFVNSRRYTSPSNYLMWFSLSNQTFYAFQGSVGKWKLIDSCRCTTGDTSSYSHPRFDMILYKSGNWHGVVPFGGGGYAPYACYLHENAMHGWVYYDYNCTSPTPGNFGRVGSHGCLRVIEDVIGDIWADAGKYVMGTTGSTVVVY